MSRIIDSDTLEIVRGEYYEGAGYLAVVHNTVVFQAEVAETPAENVFAAIEFENVTTGSYEDIREGMLVLISSTTTNYTTQIEHYRVRKPPTSSILYVNEMSIDLTPGDVLTVINTYEPMQRDRRLTYVDWDKPYEDPAPAITNMDSAYAVITRDASATLSFAPIAVGMAEGDSTDPDDYDYEWEFDATPIYNTGDATSREIEVELPSTVEWGRLTATTVGGVSTWFAFTIHIGHPSTDSRFIQCHDPVDIDASVENGYNASTTAYANLTLTTVMDRTRCVVIVDESYDSVDLGYSPIRFVGYLVKDTNLTQGDEKHGSRQSSQIEMQGFKTLAAELPMFPIAIRDTSSPDAWDEIDNPTTERVIWHILSQHSTLPNLCAFDFGASFTTTPNKWYSGNPDVSDTSLMDAVKSAASELPAELTCNPAGGFVFERHGSFLTEAERLALPDVIPDDMNTGDVFELTLTREHKPRVGKVEMGARVFFSNGAPSVGYTAMAPAVAIGEGQERVTIPNALLPADDITDAATAASERAAYWYAFKNNLLSLSTSLTDGWGAIMSPSVAQWWPFAISASDTTRGVVINSTTRWLLMSVKMRINANGTQTVQPVWQPATTAGRALILVAISPSVASTDIPMMPVRSVIPAYPAKPSINYDTTSPTTKQTRDAFSGMQSSPWPTADAAEAGRNQAGPDEWVQSPPIYFTNSLNVVTPWVTVLGRKYTVFLSGSAVIDSVETCFDFTTGAHGWLPPDNYVPTEGFERDDYRARPDRLVIDESIGVACTSVTVTFNEGIADPPGASNAQVNLRSSPTGGTTYQTIVANGQSVFTFEGDFPAGINIEVQTNGVPLPNPDISPTLRLIGLCYVPVNAVAIHGDAFYWSPVDEDGVWTNPQLYDSTQGYRINNAAVSVPPPYNDNHEYSFEYTGDGNVIYSRFEDSNYADNQRLILYERFAGLGVGE